MNRPHFNEWGREVPEPQPRLPTSAAAKPPLAQIRAESDAFLASYRARGIAPPVRNTERPSAAKGHMPFPGHRHCGETG